jgi:transcriptional repressor NrdR
MKCPYCDCHDTRVVDSRESPDLEAVRRRRHCVACEKRFTTYERWERPDLRVVKRNGLTQDFDREKLERGILRACEKRPISRDDVVRLIDSIEEEARRHEGDFPTTEIGAAVLEGLKRLDGVAYMRFASVYKEFHDVEHFAAEIKAMKQSTLDEPKPRKKGAQ